MHRRIYILLLSIAALAPMVTGCNGPESSNAAADAGVKTDDARDSVASDVNPDTGPFNGCGNGRIDDGEACDGDELAGRTCAGFGFDGGELSCMQNCAGFLVEGCHGVPSWTTVEPSPCQACEADEICVNRQCVAGCEGQALSETSVLDTDVRTHQISADVTIGGTPVSDWLRFSEWSELFFVSSHGVITKAWASADDTFEIELLEGTYDIYWSGRLSDDSLPLPVASDVRIDASRQFDFDVNAPQMTSFSVTAPDWFSPFEVDIEARVAGAPDDLPHLEIGRHAKLDQHEFSVWAAAPIAVTVSQLQGSPGDVEPIGPRFFELEAHVTDTLTAPLELPLRRVELVADDLGPAPDEPTASVWFHSIEPVSDQRGENDGGFPMELGETRTAVIIEGSYRVSWQWRLEVGAGSGSRHIEVDDNLSVEIPTATHYAMRTIDLSEVDLNGANFLTITVQHPEAGRVALGRFAPLNELEVGMPQGESAIMIDSYRDDELVASWIAPPPL